MQMKKRIILPLLVLVFALVLSLAARPAGD